MAAKKVGELIKEARAKAGLSQEKLASGIPGLSASDISKAERGEKDLTQDQLKAIAKATGVTQKSLLEAAAGKTTAKTTTAKTTEKTTTGKTTSGKTTAKTTGKTTSTSDSSMKLTAAEKKLVELYRAADSDTKKKAVSILKGEIVDGGDIISSLLESAIGQIMKK